MDITGKFITRLSEQSGTSKDGKEWNKAINLFDLGGQYPKQLAVTMWKDQAKQKFKVGETYTLKCDIESREFNGKYYTDCKCFGIANNSISSARPQEQQPQTTTQDIRSKEVKNGVNNDNDSGLPF